MKSKLVTLLLFIFFTCQYSIAQVEQSDTDSSDVRLNKVFIGFYSGYNGASKAPALSWHANYQRQIIEQLSLGLNLGYVQSTTASEDLDLSEFDTLIFNRKISQGYFKTALIVSYVQNFKKDGHQLAVGLGPAISFNRKAQVIREEEKDDFYLDDVLVVAGRKGQIKPGISGMLGYTYTGKRHFVCGIHVMFDAIFGKNNPSFFNVLPGVSLGGNF